MWMQPRRLALAVLMVVMGYFLLTLTQTSVTDTGDTETAKASIIMFADNIQVRTYNANGQQTHQINGLRVEQADEQLSLISQPDVRLVNPDASEWVVTAHLAEFDNRHQIKLLKGVEATKAGTNAIDIASDSLFINTQTQVISTQDPVTFLTQSGKLSAIGMTFDTKAEFIEFSADVHTTLFRDTQ